MISKQLSVFIENRQGRLEDVLNVLKDNNVNILSLSLADTTEYGLLRLIVDKPEIGKNELAKNGFSTMLTDVVIIKIKDEIGALQKLLKSLSSNQINIEYMYGLSIVDGIASIVIKTSNLNKANEIIGDYLD